MNMSSTPGPGFYHYEQGEKILSKSFRVKYGYISSSGISKDLYQIAGSGIRKNEKKEEIGPGYYDISYTQVLPRAVLGNIDPRSLS